MWTWITGIASRFLFSKQSGIMAIVLGVVAAGAGWYLVHTIQQNTELRQDVRQSNANTERLKRQLTAERTISKHKSLMETDIANAPEHNGCPEPRILRDTISGLHDADSGAS
jgi:hypothetical protein